MTDRESTVRRMSIEQLVDELRLAIREGGFVDAEQTEDCARAALQFLTLDVEYEWRLTYDIGDGAGGVVRESFGLDEKGARAALARYEANPDITDLKLWRRPKPAKWEIANGL